MRLLALALLLAPAAAAAQPGAPDAHAQLADAERAWLDAYVHHDREAMAEALAEGFTITFGNGSVQTRDDVITGLNAAPDFSAPDGPVHYTEGRTIRILGDTAILTGVYVSPSPGDLPDRRSRYTDTWMWVDGRWRVVASHLSRIRD